MTGLIIGIVLALAATLAAWRLGRLDFNAMTIVAAALCVGLAGYAWQGRPALPGKPGAEDAGSIGEATAFADERGHWLTSVGSDGQWLTFADALTRAGMSRSAVTAMKSGIAKSPNSPALWVGLGNALVVHADGLVTPAAQLAFDRARTLDPKSPAPSIFEGEALLRSGDIDGAERMWTSLYRRAPADAAWRGEVATRLQVIQALRAMAAQQQAAAAKGR